MNASRLSKILLGTLVVLAAYGAGIITSRVLGTDQPISLVNPFVTDPTPAPRPLLTYTIPNLQHYPYQTSDLHIERMQRENDGFASYVFSYTTMGKKMSGQLNIPESLRGQVGATDPHQIILLLRGYVPPELFDSGVGTKNAASVFARAGYITIAPDFFGYGTSDAEFEDSWKARFSKPVQVIELIQSVRAHGVPLSADTDARAAATISGIWAHSNGGQIALTTLEVMDEPIPTTLWAPVTAPFPYSILFFGDEEADEGKAQRAWIAQFEREYDVSDFTLSQHLDLLQGPLQIHHGTTDDAALYAWSTEFEQKLRAENERRAQRQHSAIALAATASAELNASAAATPASPLRAPISYQLFTYPGADHNLQPAENWNQAIARDVHFFEEHSKK